MGRYLTNPETIAAIIPVYQAIGDAATIIYRDGSSEDIKKLVRTILKRIARHYCTDLVLLKGKAKQVAGKSLYNPVVLGSDIVLVPLKLRKPRVQRDNTLGYVNLTAVEAVYASQLPGYKTTLRLQGGTELHCLWSTSTVKHQLKQADFISTGLRNRLPWTEQNSDTGNLTSIAKKLVELCCEIIKK